MGMGVTIGNAAVGGPTGVSNTNGVSIHGTGGITDHLNGISLVVWTGFLDDCLCNIYIYGIHHEIQAICEKDFIVCTEGIMSIKCEVIDG